jgi:hypothetical protein
MARMIRNGFRYSVKGFLRVWSYLLGVTMGIVGFTGCCEQNPYEYGIIQPDYGPIQTKYGPIQVEYTQDSPAAMEDDGIED